MWTKKKKPYTGSDPNRIIMDRMECLDGKKFLETNARLFPLDLEKALELHDSGMSWYGVKEFIGFGGTLGAMMKRIQVYAEELKSAGKR